jgi:YD repeat-containing protein
MLTLETVHAQNVPNAIPKVIPASPTAANLGSYGNTDVSLYTGTPDIRIPLTTVALGDYTLPVNISNHAGGIKVEEVSSWVGLGWNLSAGGVITRSINGLDDIDNTSGTNYNYVNQTVNLRDVYDNDIPANKAIIAKIINGQYDGEPDIYFINCPGLSGKFFYNQDKGDYIFASNQNTKIEHSANYDRWTLTNTDGIEFNFETIEYNVDGSTYTKTAWFLSNIRNLKTNTVISFEYETSQQLISLLSVQSKADEIFPGQSPPPSSGNGIKINDIRTHRLKKITYPGGYIEFKKSSIQRKDLLGDYALSSIEIHNQFQLISGFDLTYSYFKSDANLDTNSVNNETKMRLKLDKLQQWGFKDGQKNFTAPYTFSYYGDGAFVDRLAMTQDYWGYPNCNSANTLVPQSRYDNQTLPGADRSVCPTSTQLGTLINIKYPTGGYTSFEFENNRTIGGPVRTISQMAFPLDARLDYPWSTEDTTAIDYSQIKQTYFEGTFVVNQSFPSIKVVIPKLTHINAAFSDCMGGAPSISGPQVYFYNILNPSLNILAITDPMSPIVVQDKSTNDADIKEIFWPEQGTYKIVVDYGPLDLSDNFRRCYVDAFSNYTVHIQYPVENISNSQALAGGLRIKSITDHHDNDPNSYQRTVYDYNNSGTYQFVPTYEYFAAGNDGQSNFHYMRRFSVSQYPLILTQGSPVGYATVTATKYDHANKPLGKSMFYYSNFGSHPDVDNIDFPFCKSTSFEYKRGVLLQESKYSFVQDAFQLIQDKTYEYDVVHPADIRLSKSIGVKAGYYGDDNSITYIFEDRFDNSDYLVYAIKKQSYENISEDYSLQRVIEHTYAGTNTLSDTIRYIYDDPVILKPTQTIKQASDGTAQKELVRFPQQFNISSPDAAGYLALINKNMIVPVETRTIKMTSPGVNEKVVAGTLTTFDVNAFPSNIFQLQLANPLPINNFIESSVSGGTLSKDSRYQLQALLNYNNQGNLVSAQKANDMNNCYLYDYNNTYPVFEATNSSPGDIAFTSFEADSKGNWSYSGVPQADANARTGEKIYALGSGTLSKGSLNTAKTYYVSYWSKNGQYTINGTQFVVTGQNQNGWTRYEHLVKNVSSVTIQGSGYIDEVALFPENSIIKTLTYKPLVGITSETDATGKSQYYSYDEMGRLIAIKNSDGNIVKRICYNYAGYVTDCSTGVSSIQYSNSLKYQTFSRNNCGSGYLGHPVTYTVPAGQYHSFISQADADQQAQNDINNNGQNFANANGSCEQASIYMTVSVENSWSDGMTNYGDYVLRFYADQQLTVPISVSNYALSVNESQYSSECGCTINASGYTTTVSGSEVVIMSSVPLEQTVNTSGEPYYITYTYTFIHI